MTQATGIAMRPKGLSQLGGRLLWAYRIVWVAFATAALATVALALFDGTMQPVVLGLRLVKSAIVGAVAFVLFWRRQRDPVAAILSLAFLCWTITSSFDFTTAEVVPMLLDRLRFLLFALALLLFPDGKWAPKWTREVAIGSSIVFAIGAIEAMGLAPTRLFLPFAILCVLVAIAGLVQRFHSTEDETQQQQLKWVALGLVAGVGLILAARAGAALSGPAIVLEAMFQLGIVLVALGFLVPLLRYRLYDAETVISRSAAYALLTAAVVAVFAGSEALIESLGQQYLGSGIGQVSGAIAAALAAVMLAPLNERIGKWAEQTFQRDLVQLRRELPELLAEVPLDWSPRQIGEAVLPRICGAVHAAFAAVAIEDDVVAAHGIEPTTVNRAFGSFPLVLPLRCPFGRQHGSLLVGPRPDMTAYSREEIEALRAILPSLRRMIIVAKQRDRMRRSENAKRRSLRASIAQISNRIAALEERLSGLLAYAQPKSGRYG